MRMDLGGIDKPPWMTCDSARRMSGHVNRSQDPGVFQGEVLAADLGIG